MAPTMAELAAARKIYGDEEDLAGLGCLEDEGLSGQSPCATLEAEVKHLELDIQHYQEQVEHLQIEERRRTHELGRLRSELSEVSERLAYEQQSVRHHQVCQQLGLETGGGGVGTAGIGRRTMEVRAEKKMREQSEQRTGRLARHVTRLAGDTAAQQSAIDQLSRRLQRVRGSLGDADRKLATASLASSDLQGRLLGEPAAAAADAAEPADTSCSQGAETADAKEGTGTGLSANEEASGDSLRASRGKPGRSLERTKRPGKTKSTGKLPQLSF